LNAAYAAYTVYGAGITPALIATFFWKRTTPTAGAVSIFGGMLVTIIWEILTKINGDNFLGYPAIYPALLSSITLLIVISLVQPPPNPDKWKPFFKEKAR
jgi:Na+/proline symporter